MILLNLSIVSVEAQTSKSINGKMQVFDVSENVNIHTMIYGEGPPIIMLPGLAGSGIEQFTEMGVKISENGYTVL